MWMSHDEKSENKDKSNVTENRKKDASRDCEQVVNIQPSGYKVSEYQRNIL